MVREKRRWREVGTSDEREKAASLHHSADEDAMENGTGSSFSSLKRFWTLELCLSCFFFYFLEQDIQTIV